MTRYSRRTVAVFAVAVLLAAFQTSTSASHAWGPYHWARAGNPFVVTMGDNVSLAWDQYLATAETDWSRPGNWLIPTPTDWPDVLDMASAAGLANPRNCRPTSGRVEVCNANYGNTGWLGVAQIWISGGVHITQGTVKLNDTYFNTAKYNTPGWRQMVVCQETGHTLGLTHQDETFNNVNLGTCMDYTNSPGGGVVGNFNYGPSNIHPNRHDYDELDIIYGHPDPLPAVKSSPGASGADVEAPSQWGQLMKTTHGGRTQIFERDFGNGERIVTFVIWA